MLPKQPASQTAQNIRASILQFGNNLPHWIRKEIGPYLLSTLYRQRLIPISVQRGSLFFKEGACERPQNLPQFTVVNIEHVSPTATNAGPKRVRLIRHHSKVKPEVFPAMRRRLYPCDDARRPPCDDHQVRERMFLFRPPPISSPCDCPSLDPSIYPR